MIDHHIDKMREKMEESAKYLRSIDTNLEKLVDIAKNCQIIKVGCEREGECEAEGVAKDEY